MIVLICLTEAQIDGAIFLKLNENQMKSIVSSEATVIKLQDLQLQIKVKYF